MEHASSDPVVIEATTRSHRVAKRARLLAQAKGRKFTWFEGIASVVFLAGIIFALATSPRQESVSTQRLLAPVILLGVLLALHFGRRMDAIVRLLEDE